MPEDLSVIGFDNIPEAAYCHPALTTVDQFIDKMGYVATEMLIDLIKGEPLDSDPVQDAHAARRPGLLPAGGGGMSGESPWNSRSFFDSAGIVAGNGTGRRKEVMGHLV